MATRPETENLSHPDVLATLAGTADLVVGAIGDDIQEELLGEAIYSSGNRPPMILARTLHGGAAFCVALIRPGFDACIACLAAYFDINLPTCETVTGTTPSDRTDEIGAAHLRGVAGAAHLGHGLRGRRPAAFPRCWFDSFPSVPTT